MANERVYTSRRMAIANALAVAFKAINGSGSYRSNIYDNSSTKLKFWGETSDFPAVYVTPDVETREYHGGGYKNRFLNITVRAYVKKEDPLEELEALIEDIETVIETNSKLVYTDRAGNAQATHQITMQSIETDGGVLAPYGIAQISCQVQY